MQIKKLRGPHQFTKNNPSDMLQFKLTYFRGQSMFDVEILSRLQFAFTIMFHYLFPPLSIGLGSLMVIMEGLYLKTKNPVYEEMTKFLTKIFAVNFAVCVASGIVMEFEFGTNWATYSRFVGDVFGSALAAEGIFAFFLESGFLAILVFGWDRVSPKVHFLSTVMVALGSIFSSVWIVIANAWMQSPKGYELAIVDGVQKAVITDFWQMCFNPSSMKMLTHTLIGAWLMGAFFVMSVSAYYILKKRHLDVAKRSFKISLCVALVMSVCAPLSGHILGKLVSKTQPAKLAAFEGHFKTDNSKGTPLYIFGHHNVKEERVDFGLAIPGGLSFLIYENFHTPVQGLDKFKKEDRPPVAISFHMFRLMLYCGALMLLLSFSGFFMLCRKKLFQSRFLLKCFVASVILPVIANQAGWIATEVGRQPWIVYGLMRTKDALSKSVTSEMVLASIIMFLVIYTLLFFVWLYVLSHKIRLGPSDIVKGPSYKEDGESQILNLIGSVSMKEKSLTEAKSKESDEK